MKHLIALLLLSTVAQAAPPDIVEREFVVRKATDGDTIEVLVPANNEILTVECYRPSKDASVIGLRLFGADTPESSQSAAKCDKELRLGNIAKFKVRELIPEGSTITFVHIPGEKYQCRLDGRIFFGPDKKDLKEYLIENGLARSYGEDGASLTKSDWCL
jgi:endonuclease YncB( thermonuclease family)